MGCRSNAYIGTTRVLHQKAVEFGFGRVGMYTALDYMGG
jgi:hypothetical protein